MPSAADLRLRLGPLVMKTNANFSNRSNYGDVMTLTSVDEQKLVKSFQENCSSDGLIDKARLGLVFEDLGIRLNSQVIDKFGIDIEPRVIQESKSSESECKSSELDDDPPANDADDESKEDVEEKSCPSNTPSPEPHIGEENALNFEQVCDILSRLYAPSYIYGKELNRASARGNIDAIEELIARGCNPKAKDGRGMTALHYACEVGTVDSVNTLLSHDVDVNARDSSGWTPLMTASANGKVAVVSVLSKFSRKPDFLLASDVGRTALHWSCLKGQRNVTKLLIAEGGSALVKAQDDMGLTALHMAALNSDEETIVLLLKSGADVATKDKTGKTARDICPNEEDATNLFGSSGRTNKK